MNRIVSVARLQLVAWPSTVGWPWGILGSSFLVNLAVFAVITRQEPLEPQTGGLMAIYIMMFIACINMIIQDFPFALGLGVTRRTFYLANVLLLVAQALGYATLLYLLSLVENATGGWGIRLRFFGISFLTQDNPILQILIYAMPFLLLGFIAIFIAAVFKRWGLNGMFTLTLVSLIGTGGLVVLLTWQRLWPTVGSWFADQSPVSLFAGWPALLALPLALAGYLTLRRTTP